MSFFKKYLKGWQFRTTTPSLTPGEEVNVFLNHYDADEDIGIVNVGDTKLYVEGVAPEHVDLRIRVEVTAFEDGVGRGVFKEVVGESSYSG